ncbi:hypothetical protein [Halorubrum ezzemoulense]|uniref:hypothetical protein n=1 Tax=Halorubrum ezzemoulense TaxID=337243 RepID=UPI001179BEC1|nr:hypothetical protein [Halorubrum ezzemoulense]
MRHNKERPCSFCGTVSYTNAILSSEPTVEYYDGGPQASVQTVVLCHDCANDVSDYFQERSGKPDEKEAGLSPFGEDDADALLSRLLENEHLVIDTGVGYGIRAVDGDWKYAIMRLPGPPDVEALERREVKDMILDAKRLTLKHLDPSAWEEFERGI